MHRKSKKAPGERNKPAKLPGCLTGAKNESNTHQIWFYLLLIILLFLLTNKALSIHGDWVKDAGQEEHGDK